MNKDFQTLKETLLLKEKEGNNGITKNLSSLQSNCDTNKNEIEKCKKIMAEAAEKLKLMEQAHTTLKQKVESELAEKENNEEVDLGQIKNLNDKHRKLDDDINKIHDFIRENEQKHANFKKSLNEIKNIF